jgi:hypothetical protein
LIKCYKEEEICKESETTEEVITSKLRISDLIQNPTS